MDKLIKDETELVLKRESEIRNMSYILIENYEIYDNKFCFKLAEKLYDNGIGINMLLDRYYYDNLFGLDEIIQYLIKKIKITYVDFGVKSKDNVDVIDHSCKIILFDKRNKYSKKKKLL